MLYTFGLFFVMFVKLGKVLFSNREHSHKCSTYSSCWWRVDLGFPQRVFKVSLSNRGDCCWGRLRRVEISVGNTDRSMNSTPPTYSIFIFLLNFAFKSTIFNFNFNNLGASLCFIYCFFHPLHTAVAYSDIVFVAYMMEFFVLCEVFV